MAMVDLKAAFMMIPVRKQDWHPVAWQVPFGLQSAPFLFNEFSVMLEWKNGLLTCH